MIKQGNTTIPTPWGTFNMIAYANNPAEPSPHLALVHENYKPSENTLLRIHSECLTGDLFGSKRCDCGEQLTNSLSMIAKEGGVLLYLRQEGRGIGLINKLKAYNLQDQGYNTADANTHLGFDEDGRQYDVALEMLNDLGIKKVRLITNNPLKVAAVADSNIDIVERVPIIVPTVEENEYYIKTKKEVFGHLF